jgi:hypothetical protein
MRKLFFQLVRSLGTWLRFCEAVQKSRSGKRRGAECRSHSDLLRCRSGNLFATTSQPEHEQPRQAKHQLIALNLFARSQSFLKVVGEFHCRLAIRIVELAHQTYRIEVAAVLRIAVAKIIASSRKSLACLESVIGLGDAEGTGISLGLLASLLFCAFFLAGNWLSPGIFGRGLSFFGTMAACVFTSILSVWIVRGMDEGAKQGTPFNWRAYLRVKK